MSETKRVEIGFDGGQVLAARLDQDGLTSLHEALASDPGWHKLPTDEGELSLDLRKVVFLRSAAGGKGIGFSG